MTPAAALIGLLVASPMVHLPTAFWQITPNYTESGPPVREKDRAVLLTHGLMPRPLQQEKVAVPELKSWQKPKSHLVSALSPDFDVFGFSYAQTVPVDAVCWTRGLRTAVGDLKKAGYREIVVIGHSAGGV